MVRSGLQTESYPMMDAIRDFEASKCSLRPSSVKRYRAIFVQLRIFCDACGIVNVDEFTPDHATWLFNELVKEKRDPKGNTTRMMTPRPKTVNLFLQTIKALFTSEVMKGHLQRNPMQHLKNLPSDRRTPEYYSRDELQAFFAQTMLPEYKNAFLGLLHSGMRFAELANLTWQDVDLTAGFLHVRSREHFRTKTVNAERSIPMNSTLRALVTDIGTAPKSRYVFCSPKGKQMRERSLLHVCKTIAARAGITSRAFLHKFRHTFASHLIQRHVSIESIKELLGHSTIRETEIYAHNRSDHLRDEVNALDKILE